MALHNEVEIERDGQQIHKGKLDLDSIAKQVQNLFDSKKFTTRWTLMQDSTGQLQGLSLS